MDGETFFKKVREYFGSIHSMPRTRKWCLPMELEGECRGVYRWTCPQPFPLGNYISERWKAGNLIIAPKRCSYIFLTRPELQGSYLAPSYQPRYTKAWIPCTLELVPGSTKVGKGWCMRREVHNDILRSMPRFITQLRSIDGSGL